MCSPGWRGVASLLGVVLGAAWYQLLGAWSSSAYVSLLASGVGLMLVLLVVPGGLAQALYGGPVGEERE